MDNRQTDRRTDRQTDGQTDRQTDFLRLQQKFEIFHFVAHFIDTSVGSEGDDNDYDRRVIFDIPRQNEYNGLLFQCPLS